MRRTARLLLTAAVFTPPFACAQTPLITESLSVLDLTRLKIGSPILLKLDAPWSGPGCTLKAASTIEGHVTALTLHSKTQPDSTLEASFESAECSEHHGQPSAFKLAALIAPKPADNGLAEASPLADVPGLAIGGSAGGSLLRSVQSASEITNYQPLKQPGLPASIKSGQVLGIPKVLLTLGKTLADSTTIIATHQNLRLEPATRFILIPQPPSDPTPAPTVASATPTPITAPTDPPPEPVDEMEACDAACAIVPATPTITTEDASQPTATIPLARMGYAPKLTREVAAFDYETNVLWLDPTHLLCTFDPHQLRTRTPSTESSRTIQAVIVNATTHAVERNLRWHVRGENRYLWQLGDGHILVSMGRELRILDSDLHTLHAFPVDRPIAWVVSSPDAQHIVVALTQELHTPQVHNDLLNTLGREPDEDLAVTVLDADLKPIFTTQRTPAQAIPVLADAGELRLKNLGHARWKIEQYGWDQKLTPITTTKSTCRPSLVADPGDLVFAVGCLSSGGRWYRMLRPNGHPLLKGESPSNETGLSAEADTAGLFAVRTVSTARSMSIGQPFHRSDLTRELISIYRARDGATVTTIATKDLTLSQQTYALSPDGHQIATIGQDSIHLFTLPN